MVDVQKGLEPRVCLCPLSPALRWGVSLWTGSLRLPMNAIFEMRPCFWRYAFLPTANTECRSITLIGFWVSNPLTSNNCSSWPAPASLLPTNTKSVLHCVWVVRLLLSTSNPRNHLPVLQCLHQTATQRLRSDCDEHSPVPLHSHDLLPNDQTLLVGLLRHVRWEFSCHCLCSSPLLHI